MFTYQRLASQNILGSRCDETSYVYERLLGKFYRQINGNHIWWSRRNAIKAVKGNCKK